MTRQMVTTVAATKYGITTGSYQQVLLVPVHDPILHEVQDDEIAHDGGDGEQGKAGAKREHQRDRTEFACCSRYVHHEKNPVGLVQGALGVTEVLDENKSDSKSDNEPHAKYWTRTLPVRV